MMRISFRGEDGNSKAPKSDNRGVLEVNLSSVVDVVNNELITVNSSYTTESVKIPAGVRVWLKWSQALTPNYYQVDIEYLSEENESLGIDEDAFRGDRQTTSFMFSAKSNKVRFIIHNKHTSDRTLRTLSISTATNDMDLFHGSRNIKLGNAAGIEVLSKESK